MIQEYTVMCWLALLTIYIQIFPEDGGVESKGAVIKTGIGVEGADDMEVEWQV